MTPFGCSALHLKFVFHRALGYFLSFTQYLNILPRISTLSFELHQTFQLCAPPGAILRSIPICQHKYHAHELQTAE